MNKTWNVKWCAHIKMSIERWYYGAKIIKGSWSGTWIVFNNWSRRSPLFRAARAQSNSANFELNSIITRAKRECRFSYCRRRQSRSMKCEIFSALCCLSLWGFWKWNWTINGRQPMVGADFFSGNCRLEVRTNMTRRRLRTRILKKKYRHNNSLGWIEIHRLSSIVSVMFWLLNIIVVFLNDDNFISCILRAKVIIFRKKSSISAGANVDLAFKVQAVAKCMYTHVMISVESQSRLSIYANKINPSALFSEAFFHNNLGVLSLLSSDKLKNRGMNGSSFKLSIWSYNLFALKSSSSCLDSIFVDRTNS